MTILLLGADGQLGCELRRSLPTLGRVVPLTHDDADFLDLEALRTVVRYHRPDVIVNAAAYTAVDAAELDTTAAFAVNAAAPSILAEEAEALKAILIHYSSDYVFDGKSGRAYVENDTTMPLSVYGRSKRDGELAVRSCRKRLIFRTSWIFSATGRNFLRTILKAAAERPDLRVVDDQIGAPTSAALIARVTAEVLAQVERQPLSLSRWGLYHLTAGGETSWYGMACHAIGQARKMGLVLKASPASVEPIGSADYPTAARRPANSRLSTAKLRQNFSVVLPHWTADVNTVTKQLVTEARQRETLLQAGRRVQE